MFNKIQSSYFIKNYSKIYPYIKPYKGRIILALLITIPAGMMDAAIAWILKPYMDEVMINRVSSSTSLFFPAFIVIFTLLQSLLNYAANYLNTWVGRKISNDVKITLFNRLMKSESSFFDNTTSGDVQVRFNGDADLACSGVLSNFKLFTTRLFSSLSLMVVLFYNSWILASVAITVLIIALFPLTRVRKKIKHMVHDSIVLGSSISTHYNEAFSGNRIVTSYNLYDYQMNKFKAGLKNMFSLGMKMFKRTGILSPMMHITTSIGIAAVIWLQGYLIITNQITPGNFISFMTALIMLYTPIKNIGNTFNSLQLSLMAIERIFGIIDSTPQIISKPEAVPLEKVADRITYRNVHFHYINNKPILEEIDLDIKVGQSIAFVGNSGGGKTTLVNLLPRFYDVTKGSIMIDGIDVRDFELDSLRDKIAVVFQDNFLFSGTIRENILLGKKDASDKEMEDAIKYACLDEFIANLDKGLDTEIGERGVLLSGGQKQRVAIARAFIKDAPIVILDEATSALDNKSEAIVQQAINNLMKDRTVLIIAHRLSTVINADKIVVVNYGKIAEIGSHKELIEKPDSVYASLYNTQV